MAKIAKKLTDLVGNTPLMELSGYSGKYGLEQNIIAKLEAFNPAGSIKDRVALSMIEDAEARGVLKPGATPDEPIIEHWNKMGKQELAERILTELSALRNTDNTIPPKS